MGLKTTCLSVTAALFVLFVFISIISDDIQGIEVKDEDGRQGKGEDQKGKGKSHVRKRESSYVDEYGNEEVHVGGKRFKLYEKKTLNYKKAKAYCKKHDGKLAEAMNLEEMRRLQVLITRAKTISNDMWVGADKKEWKKHSLKMQRRPNFGPDPMLFGGGPTEMCPALGVSTRSLIPIMCTLELPFICEFDANAKPKPKTPAPKVPTPKSASAKKSGAKPRRSGPTPKVMRINVPPSHDNDRLAMGSRSNNRRVEMRKKREIIVSQAPIHHSHTGTTDRTDIVITGSSSSPLSADDIIELGVTTKPITESPASVAAEHKIGFSPHVEHVAADPPPIPLIQTSLSGQTTPIFEDLTEVERAGAIANPDNDIVEVDEGDAPSISRTATNAGTTTVDPDQMLINLMDEQTMNLTAIELEASETTYSDETRNGSHYDIRQQQILEPAQSSKILDFIDSNNLPTSSNIIPSVESFEAQNSTDENNDLAKLSENWGPHINDSDTLELYYGNASDPTPPTRDTNEKFVSTVSESTDASTQQPQQDQSTTEAEQLKRTHRKTESHVITSGTAAAKTDSSITTSAIETTTVKRDEFSSDSSHGSDARSSEQPSTMTAAGSTEQTTILSRTLPLKQAQNISAMPSGINYTEPINEISDSSLLDVAPQDMSIILEEGYLVTEMDVSNSTSNDV